MRYAECHSAECRYAECRNTECHYAECRNAEWHYAECRSAYYTTELIPTVKRFISPAPGFQKLAYRLYDELQRMQKPS